MTHSQKITTLFAAALFFAQTTFATCPAWESNTTYSEGEKISYQSLNYEAARSVAPNTPPNPADNGWFWVETTEDCDNSVKIQADEVEIITPVVPGMPVKNFAMDKDGIKLDSGFPTGGGEGVEIDYNSITVDVGVTGGAAKTEVTPGTLELTLRSGPNADTTKVTAEYITTETVNAVEIISAGNDPRVFGKLNKETLSLQTASTNVTLSPNTGLDIMSSFGSVKIDDHGIVTSQNITANTVNASMINLLGVNLVQRILEIEARLAAIEGQE